MSKLYFRADEAAIKKKLNDITASRRDVQERSDRIVEGLFERAHASLLRNFNEHPITQELKQTTSVNISMTLGGYGNLFAFLGFNDGDDPTEPLERLIQNIKMERTSHRGNVIYYTIYDVPNKESIKSATPMTWGSASWAIAIEDGGFGGGADLTHFIYKSWENSRSKQGVQIVDEYSEDKFQPMPYMSSILDKFRDRINDSRSKFLV